MTATSSLSIFSMSRTSSIEAPHCWSTGTRKCRWRRSICAPGEKPRPPRPMRRRANIFRRAWRSWTKATGVARYELTLWSARQQDHELSDKLRACQGDDTMTVSRHRHVAFAAKEGSGIRSHLLRLKVCGRSHQHPFALTQTSGCPTLDAVSSRQWWESTNLNGSFPVSQPSELFSAWPTTHPEPKRGQTKPCLLAGCMVVHHCRLAMARFRTVFRRD
jgi:hypothetical protein